MNRMANKSVKENEGATVEAIEAGLSKTELFLEKNYKVLLIVLGCIFAVAIAWLAFQYLYLAPKNEEAQEKLAVAQQYIAQQQYQVALEGDSVEFDGLVDLIDNYGITKSGKLAKAYAGLVCYRLQRYDEAVEYLKSISLDDDALKYTCPGTVGDCYVQLGQAEESIRYFKKAAEADNDLVAAVYKFKLARVYEDLERNDEALAVYQDLKDHYVGKARMTDLDEIDKYIERLSIKHGK